MPDRAIVFGSLTDPDGALAQTRQAPHAYAVLHELGTRPRTQYLARITNPSPALAPRRGARDDGGRVVDGAGRVTARQPPVLRDYPGDAPLTDQLLRADLARLAGWWLALLGVGRPRRRLLVLGATYTVVTGIGVWGNNIPVAWAFAIINFVWWIGIGHAGTFISAFLLLLEQAGAARSTASPRR